MSTTSSIEEVNSTRRRFRITVAQDAVKSAFQSAVSHVQGTAQVKGFRKGKVPNNLVRKFFEKDVREKALESIVDSSYKESIKTADFQIVSYPEIEPVGPFLEASDFNFTATVDINPLIEITGYKDLTLKLNAEDPKIEEQIEKTLLQVSKEKGKINKVTDDRPAQKGDIAQISYKISMGELQEPEVKHQDAQLELDGSNLADLENGILGMKVKESKTFKIKFPADHESSQMQGKEQECSVTLKQLSTRELAVVDDAFALQFGAPNLEEFKRMVRESVANINEKNKIEQLKPQIMAQLLEKNSFEVPESLVEGTVDRAISEANQNRPKKTQLDGTQPQVRSQYHDWALNEVRGVLALGHIARTEGMKVEDDEVRHEMSMFAAQNGMSIQDMLKQYGNQIIEEFRGKVLIDKVIKLIIGLSKIEQPAQV